ncbi:MAG: metal ABC transporter permease [Kiritimatiellae bacterium]|nr:metal ABC transporter permease [Kiritimatiellia bacterium]
MLPPAELLRYAFVQRAVVAGLLVGLASGFLGVILLLRRSALVGEGLSHFTLGAVGIALWLGWAPLSLALPLAAAAALLMARLPERGTMFGDTAIGMVAATGLAVGSALAARGGGFRADLFAYLFGDVLAVTPRDVIVASALAVAVTVAVLPLRRHWLSITFDADHARVCGLPVHRYERGLAILTAGAVVIGLRIVGSLLMTSLLIFPAATALLRARSFTGAILSSGALGVAGVFGGLAVGLLLDVPAGPAIVLVQAAMFALAWLANTSQKRQRRSLI